MKINIFLDNKKSWFLTKSTILKNKIISLGHDGGVFHDYKYISSDSDITFFLSCEKYISKEVRNLSRHNIIIHASNLPRGRGSAPASWQILENKKRIVLTLFEVADGFDQGDYYLKDSFKLDGGELIDEWQDKLYKTLERMAVNYILNIEKLKPIKQRGRPSFYRKRTPEDSELNVNKSIKSQFNLLRVVDNQRYPAFFRNKGQKYIIKIYRNDK